MLCVINQTSPRLLSCSRESLGFVPNASSSLFVDRFGETNTAFVASIDESREVGSCN